MPRSVTLETAMRAYQERACLILRSPLKDLRIEDHQISSKHPSGVEICLNPAEDLRTEAVVFTAFLQRQQKGRCTTDRITAEFLVEQTRNLYSSLLFHLEFLESGCFSGQKHFFWPENLGHVRTDLQRLLAVSTKRFTDGPVGQVTKSLDSDEVSEMPSLEGLISGARKLFHCLLMLQALDGVLERTSEQNLSDRIPKAVTTIFRLSLRGNFITSGLTEGVLVGEGFLPPSDLTPGISLADIIEVSKLPAEGP